MQGSTDEASSDWRSFFVLTYSQAHGTQDAWYNVAKQNLHKNIICV